MVYLQLGQDFVLNSRDVIGVFDLDNTTDVAPKKYNLTEEFLAHVQKEGAVVDLGGELPKSFLLTDFMAETVYLTPLTTATIKARANRNPV